MARLRACGRALHHLLVSEIHTSKLLLCHDNWRAFTYTPWLPYRWPYQLIYVTYRWVIALYFFMWLIMAGEDEGRGKYFIYLTNWAHISYNMYLVVAASSTTVKFVCIHFVHKQQDELSVVCAQDYHAVKEPSGYCNVSNNGIAWYQMIHWLLFTVGNEAALFIMLLYWSLLYRGGKITGINANTHLINGLLALVDICISGLPVNLLHCIYLMIFGATYSVFSGLYFIISGNIIYSVLDYKNNAGGAVSLYLALIFLLLPFVHCLVYILYLGKQWVVLLVYHKCGLLDARANTSGSAGTMDASNMEMVDLKSNFISDESDI